MSNTSSPFTILHRIEIEAPPEKVTEAAASPEGLAAWWTPMTTGGAGVGAVLKARFGDGKHGPDMRIDELTPGERVTWTCVEGPWMDMRFVFDVQPHERGSALLFRHEGWPEQGEFFGHCNAKWGYFLAVSLKSYLETGQGQPHPADPSI